MSPQTSSRFTRTLKSISVKKFIDDYVYRIDLDADYQRERIWSRKSQEELLDSIIKNIDIPKLYLARVIDSETFDYECIDGKQRMATLLSFFKPESNERNPLMVRVTGGRYTYKQLRREFPKIARVIEGFELTFVIYSPIDDDEFLREIFRRLQLGVRLNSGELLKTYTGTLRDFVYKEMGSNAPYLKQTNLSEKRFSRQFTLAQICINSFGRRETGEFVRARYDDLGDFFKSKSDLDEEDENLARIRKVLGIMEKHFGETSAAISSRAVAVSAYLFVEGLCAQGREEQVPAFAAFYLKLLEDIKRDLKLLSKFREPTNRTILEGFQRHISQASVEPFAIKARDMFLENAFRYYVDPKTKGKIIGSK